MWGWGGSMGLGGLCGACKASTAQAVRKHRALVGSWVPSAPRTGDGGLGGLLTPLYLHFQGPETPKKSPASPDQVSPQNGHRSPSSMLTTSSSVSSLSSSTVRHREPFWGLGVTFPAPALTLSHRPAAERQPDEPVQRG